MALFIFSGGGRIIYTNATSSKPYAHLQHRPQQILFPASPRRGLYIASAAKRLKGKFDSKNRRITTTTDNEVVDKERTSEMKIVGDIGGKVENNFDGGMEVKDDYFLPELPGEKPDFWEGPQWDALGFFVQYLWAFGIAFALIACGIAVATYNEGATDFKDTPVYKESIQSRELLEEPDASNPEVFESNPTEMAPSLE